MNVHEYSIRPGCVNDGKEFEFRMATLLILRCIANKNVEDAWIAMNVDKCGAFDDAVVCVRTKHKIIVYLIQLKHQTRPENITPRDFRAKDSGFRLAKYHDTVRELKIETEKDASSKIIECFKQNWDNLVFVLFTNRGVNENDFMINVDKKSDKDLNWLLYDIINTNNGNAHTFNYEKLQVDQDIETLVKERFFLFVKQIHIDKIDVEIENVMSKILHPLKLSKNDMTEFIKKFISVITEWSTGNLGGYYPLTKNHTLRIIFDLLSTPYKLNIQEGNIEERVSGFETWKDILQDQAFTIIEEDTIVISYLKSFIAVEIENYCNNPKNKNLWKRHTDAISKNVLRNVSRAKKTLRFEDVYECLWKNNVIPLILMVNERNLNEIQNLLCFFDQIQNQFRIILLGSSGYSLLNTKNIFCTLANVNKECREKILKLPVKLQGRSSVTLLKLVENEMLSLISVKDIIYILYDKFNIGNHFNSLPDIFIERTLEKIYLDKEILEDELEDYFVIICNLIDDFEKFRENSLHFQVFQESVKISDCKVTVLENRDKCCFEQLDQDIPDESVHYLFLHPNGKLEWIRTVGSIRNITKFRKPLEFSSSRRSSEILYNLDVQRTHIISAFPGMGKSVLMDTIFRDTSTDRWVIRVDLFEHTDYYKSEEFDDATAIEHLTYFNNSILEKEEKLDDLNKSIFETYLENNQISVLLDGFDEISVNLQKKVKEMLKCLQEFDCVIFITTRPILRDSLEKLLNNFAISINPFTPKDQKTFLSQHFLNIADSFLEAHLRSDELEDKVFKFVKKLLAAAKDNLNDYEQEFTGIPLQTKLLAEVFSNDFIKFARNGIFECEYFDLLYLYRNFIEEKIRIVCDRFGGASEDMLYRYKMHRSLCALQVLFRQEDLVNLNIQQLLELEIKVFPDTLQLVQKDGIVITENPNNITFVHRTFAEYLAAEWLSENIDGEHQETVKKLLRITFNTNFEIIRNIFDRILAKKCPLHLAVINRKVGTVMEITNSSKFDNKLDNGKRSFLHLIASWGLNHPQNVPNEMDQFQNRVAKNAMGKILNLIPNKCLQITKDSLLKYTPLDYAILSGSLSIANEICARLEHVDDYVSLTKDDLNYRYITFYLNSCTYPSFGAALIKHAVTTDLQNRFKDLKSKYKTRNSLEYNIIMGSIKNVSVAISMEKDFNKQDEQGYGFLHISSIFSQPAITQMLLTNRVDVNLQDHSGKTSLHWACALGNHKIVSLLLVFSANINIVDNDGMTALHYAIIACSKNKHEIISDLIKAKADLSILDYNNKTPLHYTLHYNHLEILKILLRYGADIDVSSEEDTLQKLLNCKDSDGGTILHWAADKGCLETVRLLLDFGADAALKDDEGNTPLHWAVQRGHADIMNLLLTYQKNVNLQNKAGFTALHLAAHYGHDSIINELSNIKSNLENEKTNLEIKNAAGSTALMVAVLNNQVAASTLLLSKNVEIESKNNNGMNALLCASDKGYTDIIDNLLARNANIEAKNVAGLNALLYAADNGNEELIELLLSRNANIEAKDNSGATAFLYAVLNGYRSIIDLLLLKDADVNVCDDKGRNALHYAVYKDYPDIVETLLSKDVNAEARDDKGETPLHYAAHDGKLSIIQSLIAKGASIDAQTNNGDTALHYASYNGHTDVVEFLLSKHANLELQNKHNRSPIFSAVYYGRTVIVQMLLSNGANIDSRDTEGDTPLLRAAYKGELECVELLLANNANINAKSNDGNNILLRAAIKSHIEIIEFSLSKGIDVDSQNDLGNTALHLASYDARCDIMEVLLSYSSSIELKDKKGNAALIYATFSTKTDAISLLLSKGADIETANNEGQTPLMYAAETGKIKAVELLISKDAKVDARNIYGNTPLLNAAFCGHKEIVEILLSKGADLNVKNEEGNSALHRAASNNKTDVAKLLLLKGIDPGVENHQGFTPLDQAAYYNKQEVFELFLSKIENQEMKHQAMEGVLLMIASEGFDNILQSLLDECINVEVKNPQGQTALLLAVYFDHRNFVRLLLSAGADVNVFDNNGYTALHMAANNGLEEMTKVLLSHEADPNIKNDRNESPLDLALLNNFTSVVDLLLGKMNCTE